MLLFRVVKYIGLYAGIILIIVLKMQWIPLFPPEQRCDEQYISQSCKVYALR